MTFMPKSAENSHALITRLKEAAFISIGAISAYVLLSLASHNSLDPGWSTTGSGTQIFNLGGIAGAWISDILFSLVGYMAYFFPVLLIYKFFRLLLVPRMTGDFSALNLSIRSLGMILVIISGASLISMTPLEVVSMPQGAGGIVGIISGSAAFEAFGATGGRLLLVGTLLFGLTILTDLSWLGLIDQVGGKSIKSYEFLVSSILILMKNIETKQIRNRQARTRRVEIAKHVERENKRKPRRIKLPKQEKEKSDRAERERQQKLFQTPVSGELPALQLLDDTSKDLSKGYSSEALQGLSKLLELKLSDFGVNAEVTSVYPGPVITRFEIQPAAGVKVSRISNLAKDLARSLSVISVRVVEVIPGKSSVGIEIPNEHREIVNFKEVLSSKAFDKSKSPLSLALGHDISGQPVVADLAKMPHLLVAGTTGSGKSVGVNCMLMSLLYKASPSDVRLILVDPKMLELSVYDGIPHLLTPVITDMKDAANGLRWCVAEMERRYKLMASLGVRNLSGYNKKISDANNKGSAIPDPLWKPDDNSLSESSIDPPNLEDLPAIVVVIDEFADMMMIVGKKVEQLIARIAQKARAAGIHLILATQRPSVDVITGLIKANIPTRIAFQVSSKVDSRTILDQGGAEQLLGHGDMLFLPPGSGVPTRVHGAFCSDEEVHRVAADWKNRGDPNYISDLIDDGRNVAVMPNEIQAKTSSKDHESDPLYDEAVSYVTKSRRASISSVQRKLRIGYNRAARLIEAMEKAGVVTEMASNGQREVIAPPPVSS